MRRALVVLALLAGSAAASPMAELEDARASFRQKDYDNARKLLKDILVPNEKLSDRQDLFEAHAMLGACEIEIHEPEEAKKEFEKALQLMPDKELDPLFFSSNAVRSFDDVKVDIEARAKAQQAKTELQKALANLRVFEHHHYYQVFLPFGAGQFQNGDNVKGTILASAQALTFGTSFGIWYYLVDKYGLQSSNVKLADGPTVRFMQEVEIGSGIAFLALYAYSVYDANRHFKRDVFVPDADKILRELDKPVDESPKPPPKPTKTTIHWGPILVPGGAGIGLAWEN